MENIMSTSCKTAKVFMYTIKAYNVVELKLQSFLTVALYGSE